MKLLAVAALALSFALVGCSKSTQSAGDASVFTASNTATAKVDGMTCAACEGAVCSAIEKIDGVQAVAANAETGEIRIALKEGAKLDVDAVKKAVSEAEFTVSTDITLPEGFCPAGCTKDCCMKPADPEQPAP